MVSSAQLAQSQPSKLVISVRLSSHASRDPGPHVAVSARVTRRDQRWNHNIHYHRLILQAVPPGCQRVLDVGCGEGARLFENVGKSRHLDLLSSTAFSSGLQLDYRRHR